MLQLRKDEFTGTVSQYGYGMQGCAILEFPKYRQHLRNGLYKDLGATRRTFRVVADSDGQLYLRIEGDPGVCLIPVTAKPEDIDATM